MTSTLDAEGRTTAIGEGLNTSSPYTTTYGYNPNDLPVSSTLPNGVQESMGYDPDSRLITTTALGPTGVVTPLNTSYSYAYNPSSWTTAITSVVSGITSTTLITHDALGRMVAGLSNGNPQSWSYGGNGNLLSVVNPSRTSTYSYDQDDQPISATMPNSINGTMSYDKNSRLTGWTYSGPSTGVTTSTVNLQYGFGYDAADHTTGITVTDNGVTTSEPVTHNAAGWITGWVGPSPNGPQTWGYNSDGNIISTTSFINNGFHTTVFTYSATQPNELVQQHTDSLGVATYKRDSYGNTISEVSTDPITSPYYVNKTFHYDALERPITATNVQNGATITTTLGYNAASERITYTAVTSGQVVDSEKFAYNDDGSLAQTIATTATLNGNGSIKNSGAYTDAYAYDPLGEPLYLLRQQNGTTNAYSYLTDGHGNVVGSAMCLIPALLRQTTLCRRGIVSASHSA